MTAREVIATRVCVTLYRSEFLTNGDDIVTAIQRGYRETKKKALDLARHLLHGATMTTDADDFFFSCEMRVDRVYADQTHEVVERAYLDQDGIFTDFRDAV